jgi:hypothetical protein
MMKSLLSHKFVRNNFEIEYLALNSLEFLKTHAVLSISIQIAQILQFRNSHSQICRIIFNIESTLGPRKRCSHLREILLSRCSYLLALSAFFRKIALTFRSNTTRVAGLLILLYDSDSFLLELLLQIEDLLEIFKLTLVLLDLPSAQNENGRIIQALGAKNMLKNLELQLLPVRVSQPPRQRDLRGWNLQFDGLVFFSSKFNRINFIHDLALSILIELSI